MHQASQDLLAFIQNARPIEKAELLIAQLQAVLLRLDAHRDTGHAV